jgi:hypothetical protein
LWYALKLGSESRVFFPMRRCLPRGRTSGIEK